MSHSELVLTLDEESGAVKARVLGPWREEYAQHFVKGECTALELNGEKGFDGEDLDFLAEVPMLRELEVVGAVTSDRGVQYCPRLQRLNLNTSSQDRVDFSQFRDLRHVYLGQLRGKESLLGLAALESLYAYGYPYRDLAPLRHLTALQRLELGPARRLDSLEGLPGSTELRLLGLYYAPQLRFIEEIGEMASLTSLEIYGCRKVEDLSPVGRLHRLQRLLLIDCGRIASLRPIRTCLELKNVLVLRDNQNSGRGPLGVGDSAEAGGCLIPEPTPLQSAAGSAECLERHRMRR